MADHYHERGEPVPGSLSIIPYTYGCKNCTERRHILWWNGY
ncbi:hypothetical protein LCGC14_2034010, partial [marine sediment metagenome]